MPVRDDLDIIPLKCPYCKTPMRLTFGNSGFSYWSCAICNKEFEFHIQTEQFTDEETSNCSCSNNNLSFRTKYKKSYLSTLK